MGSAGDDKRRLLMRSVAIALGVMGVFWLLYYVTVVQPRVLMRSQDMGLQIVRMEVLEEVRKDFGARYEALDDLNRQVDRLSLAVFILVDAVQRSAPGNNQALLERVNELLRTEEAIPR